MGEHHSAGGILGQQRREVVHVGPGRLQRGPLGRGQRALAGRVVRRQPRVELAPQPVERGPAHLDLARSKFRVGNLYLNRGSTGALVERQPFGGFQMSGGGSKAGGPGYLVLFSDPRVVTENTMRRGFTPDLAG